MVAVEKGTGNDRKDYDYESNKTDTGKVSRVEEISTGTRREYRYLSVVEPVQLWPGSGSGYRLRLTTFLQHKFK